MIILTRVVSACAAVCLAAACLLTAACVSEPVDGGLSLRSTSEVPAPEPLTPALTREDDSGDATAVGTLVYRRDRGGFFALADLLPGMEPTTTARLIVMLVGSDGSRQAPDLVPLVGAYCLFSGTLRNETSVTALPELVFESYRVVSSPSGE